MRAPEFTWPTTFVDPFLTGPAYDDRDTPELVALIDAGLDNEARATAQAGAAAIRSLIDPMSGRIDNWSQR